MSPRILMLTKSDFLKFSQCPKYLWLGKHRKDLLSAELDAGLEKRFKEGAEVEQYAYRLFPEGVSASAEGLKEAISKSQKLIRGGAKAVFQPTITSGELFCRADIIRFDRRTKKWDIFEVKSSTEVKDMHVIDLGFQRFCLERAGLPVGRVNVIHVNNEYVRQGEVDPEGLLKIADVTAEVGSLFGGLGNRIDEALAVLRQRVEPDTRILRQCSNPYDCPFLEHCWRDVPEHSIYNLGLSEEKLNELLDRGITRLEDVPEEFVAGTKKQAYYDAVKSGEARVLRKKIGERLAELVYPLHFLDYETYGSAIPPFDGYRPYQQIPFQYSLHVQAKPGAKTKHFEFLAGEFADPVPKLAAQLKKEIGPRGSVLAWNAGFEGGCNDLMGERHPKFRDFFAGVNERLFDPMLIVRDGLYVDGKFMGSASLKKVQPVLAPDLSYKELEIQEGGAALAAWPVLTAPATPDEEKKRLRTALLKYCALDTLAMVRILEQFREIAA